MEGRKKGRKEVVGRIRKIGRHWVGRRNEQRGE